MTTSEFPYPYRMRKTCPGVASPVSHFRTLQAALTHAAEYLSPTSAEACAPRRGHPFDQTLVHIERRVSWSSWEIVHIFRYTGTGDLVEVGA